MTTRPAEMTPEQQITVIKQSAAGRDVSFIATATGLSPQQIEQVRTDHGYPDGAAMAAAVEWLSRGSGRGALPPGRFPSGSPARPKPVPPRSAPRLPVPEPVVERPPVRPSAGELIVAASKSPKAVTRNLGTRVAALLGDLSGRLEAEAAEDAAAEEMALQQAQRQKEIDRLEAKLRQLKQAQKTSRSTRSAACSQDEVPAAVVRAWARENGVDCPNTGRVPRTVQQAYDQAHPSAA